jgi:hypothetical protein
VAEAPPKFDPIGSLGALERQRVNFIVVGALARIIQGTGELTRGLDIVPSMKPENLRRLNAALRDLDARRADGRDFSFEEGSPVDEPTLELITDRGEMKIVPQPAGTRGYDDLKRAATREPLGSGVRPSVASVGDLGRMLAALGREADEPRLRTLRRLAELEPSRGLEL